MLELPRSVNFCRSKQQTFVESGRFMFRNQISLFGLLGALMLAAPANATIIGGSVTGGAALSDGGVF